MSFLKENLGLLLLVCFLIKCSITGPTLPDSFIVLCLSAVHLYSERKTKQDLANQMTDLKTQLDKQLAEQKLQLYKEMSDLKSHLVNELSKMSLGVIPPGAKNNGQGQKELPKRVVF